MPMKKTLLSCALVLLCASASAAPASPESVETLLELINAKQLVDGAHAGMESSIRQGMTAALGNVQPTAEQSRKMEVLSKALVAAIEPEFNWATLKPEFVRLYTETFTQEEIDGISQFYSSPIGASMIAKMPLLQARCIEITQNRMAAAIPKVQAAVAAAMVEMQPAQ